MRANISVQAVKKKYRSISYSRWAEIRAAFAELEKEGLA